MKTLITPVLKKRHCETRDEYDHTIALDTTICNLFEGALYQVVSNTGLKYTTDLHVLIHSDIGRLNPIAKSAVLFILDSLEVLQGIY